MKLVMFVETVSFLIMRMLGWALDQHLASLFVKKAQHEDAY